MIPHFPELRPFLEAAFDEAPTGSEYVITRHRIGSANLRTTFERILLRVWEKPWERLFQNPRASRETELARQHPLHVVTAWIGNSAIIANKHHLMVEDADFDKALESGARGRKIKRSNRP